MPEKDFFADIHDHKSPPTYKYFNGHEWRTSASGKTTDVISPVDHDVLGRVPVVTHGEIDDALSRARKAQRAWAQVPIIERTKKMHLAADWMRHHVDRLATLLTREIGKPIGSSKSEINRSADMIDYFSHEALSLQGEQLPADAFPGYDKSRIGFIERVPLGVVLAIAPFNYPVNLSVSKIAPALVTGNAVAFKPPTNGAISALHMVQIFRRAGIPDDILLGLTGDGREIGDYLVGHSAVNMITFTGSSSVGQAIAKKSGMIPLLFECGGNNPALVLDDCDLNHTAQEIVKGAFSFAGQRCTAIKYVLALPRIVDKLVPKIKLAMKDAVKMGDPRKTDTKMVGPIISESAAREIEHRINDAVSHGAKVVSGGTRDGNYIAPTVLDTVTPDMEIVKIETFGPVVSLIRVKSIDEAVEIINSSTYGLQASIYTEDEGAAIRLAQKLDVGTIWINGKPQRGPDHFPFLGVKGSGVGVQGIKYTLNAMTRLRPIVMNQPK